MVEGRLVRDVDTVDRISIRALQVHIFPIAYSIFEKGNLKTKKEERERDGDGLDGRFVDPLEVAMHLQPLPRRRRLRLQSLGER